MKGNKSLFSEIENAAPERGLALVAAQFPGQVTFSSSLGQEDQVITDMIFSEQLPVRVFTIDTGRLFTETYELIDRTHARYGRHIRIYFPETADVEAFVTQKGINGFYDSAENRKTCCHIRKVKPLNRALAGMKVWITGLRAGQSANREHMPVLAWDETRQLYKYNPLINWSLRDVSAYLEKNRVPYNTLHDRGFPSIGCAPCTRAVTEGEDARAGRWWWETSQKECGLHPVTINNTHE